MEGNQLGEPQLLNKLDVDEVELVLPVPSTKANSVNAPVKLNKTQIAFVKARIFYYNPVGTAASGKVWYGEMGISRCMQNT